MTPLSVNITDRTSLRNLLLSLYPDTTPLWGNMKAQQMVEHLVDQVQWTNGKKIPTCDRPADEAYKRKMVMVYTDAQISKNIFSGTLPEEYQYLSISAAVDALIQELDAFDQYFLQPGAIAIHGGFGPMNHQEWVVWHGKHFAHHFMQFGLIGE
jgi:oxepin-CoA hydrolase/3-oxo-5,6-dehydrosuberyl-CoA semialdehyde dehydrogenase